jgi:hypothetical protein
MALTTPVVFLIFNRPETTERVFARIAAARPRKLFVVADGPRHAEEAANCEKARLVTEKVDWDCEVQTRFSETNLGCRKNVGEGLNWVFSQVEEAIILEDDCLPDASFFPFCETLLARYRDDERVMLITGTNPFPEVSRNGASYHFSKYGSIWGWASWRRAWRHFDDQMTTWPEFRDRELMRGVFEDPEERAFWVAAFEKMYHRPLPSWAFQWFFARLSQSGLSVVPNTNLVSNIGFGEQATNTKSKNELSELGVGSISEITHPPVVVPLRVVDACLFRTAFASKKPQAGVLARLRQLLTRQPAVDPK